MSIEPAQIAGYGLQLAAGALAVLLARRHRAHRPVAALLVAVALADPGRAALHLLKPFASHGEDLGRLLMGVDVAMWSIEPLGLLVAAVATLAPGRWPHAAGASLAGVTALIVVWPWGPPQAAQRAVLGAALVIVGILWIRELRRKRLRWAGRPATIALMLLAAAQIGALFGPWLAANVWAAWKESWPGTIAIGAGLAAAHAAWLADSSSPLSSSKGGGAPL